MRDPGSIFASAAPYYARYRQPYDPRVFPELVAELGLGASSTVLDLGTGTGAVALALAPLVGRVVAVDPSADMLAEARSAPGAEAVEWRTGDSTRLDELGLPPQDAVTMGRSFHWMDRPAVLRDLDRLVAPGGGIALLRTLEFFRTSPDDARFAWLGAVREVVDRFGLTLDRGYVTTESHLEALRASPFSRIEVRTLEHGSVHLTLDEVVGTQFSYSYTSPARLGDRLAAFEADLRETLLAVEPSGSFPIGEVATELVVAVRP